MCIRDSYKFGDNFSEIVFVDPVSLKYTIQERCLQFEIQDVTFCLYIVLFVIVIGTLWSTGDTGWEGTHLLHYGNLLELTWYDWQAQAWI